MNVNVDASAALREWLIAGGTIGATVAALLIAGIPALLKHHRRPILRPEVTGHGPHVREALAGGTTRTVYLRMRVYNDGKSEARRVRATLLAWRVFDTGAQRWTSYEIDPAALHWVSMTHAREQNSVLSGAIGPSSIPQVLSSETHIRPTPPEVNLPPRLHDYVDLVSFTLPSGPLSLVLDDDRMRGFRQQAHAAAGTFLLTIAVTAENADGVETQVVFTTHSPDGIIDAAIRSDVDHLADP